MGAGRRKSEGMMERQNRYGFFDCVIPCACYNEGMVFDFKKEYKDLYSPKTQPSIVKVAPVNYLAVRGHGDPNVEGGEYKTSIGLLYAIAFTLKMSYKGDYRIDGYFPYVVPPLEGLWWQEGRAGIDYTNKAALNFISMIRLPDFVREKDFEWAIREATEKKGGDFSKVEFFPYAEDECVQCMHIGSYDDEPVTLACMHQYATKNGYQLDEGGERLHHEIYLSDPRRVVSERLKTVIRQPVVKMKEL